MSKRLPRTICVYLFILSIALLLGSCPAVPTPTPTPTPTSNPGIIAQEAYLKALNAEAYDYFGFSVAISGDTMVVGAYLEDSSSAMNPNDNGASDSGAAYVFVRSGTAWTQQAYLKASNAEAEDYFGLRVSISGETIVVGARGEDSSATGGQSDNSTGNSGAAYVFVRSGTSWTQQAYLKAFNAEAGDEFGMSVSISGDRIVVGAACEDSSATGGQSDNSADYSGAAYVFVRSGTSWTQEAYLKASNAEAGDNFGYNVAISGDTIVVGAYGEDSSATGGQSDNSADYSGAAYVFVRSGTSWTQEAYLKASNAEADDCFGLIVSISGDRIVVGVSDEDSSATGGQSDNSASFSGAAYVFVRSGTSWTQEAYLKASNAEAYDNFGTSVSISGDRIVVGAACEDSSATGGQSDNSTAQSGAAYVFVRSGTSWTQLAYLKASNAEASDFFGTSVAISDDTIVVGTYSEDSSATGGQSDNSASVSGAAYVFR